MFPSGGAFGARPRLRRRTAAGTGGAPPRPRLLLGRLDDATGNPDARVAWVLPLIAALELLALLVGDAERVDLGAPPFEKADLVDAVLRVVLIVGELLADELLFRRRELGQQLVAPDLLLVLHVENPESLNANRGARIEVEVLVPA